jgi:hypothetical protein
VIAELLRVASAMRVETVDGPFIAFSPYFETPADAPRPEHEFPVVSFAMRSVTPAPYLEVAVRLSRLWKTEGVWYEGARFETPDGGFVHIGVERDPPERTTRFDVFIEDLEPQSAIVEQAVKEVEDGLSHHLVPGETLERIEPGTESVEQAAGGQTESSPAGHDVEQTAESPAVGPDDLLGTVDENVAGNVVPIGYIGENGPWATGLWIDPATIVTAAEPFRGVPELQVLAGGESYSASAMRRGEDDAGLLFLSVRGIANSEPAMMAEEAVSAGSAIVVSSEQDGLHAVAGRTEPNATAQPWFGVDVETGGRDPGSLMGAPVILESSARPAGIVVGTEMLRTADTRLRVASAATIRHAFESASRRRDPADSGGARPAEGTFTAKVVVVSDDERRLHEVLDRLGQDFARSPDGLRAATIVQAHDQPELRFVCGLLGVHADPDWPLELSAENAAAIVFIPSAGATESKVARPDTGRGSVPQQAVPGIGGRVESVAQTLGIPFVDLSAGARSEPPERVSKMRPPSRSAWDLGEAAALLRLELGRQLSTLNAISIEESEIGPFGGDIETVYSAREPAETMKVWLQQRSESAARWRGADEALTGVRRVPDANLAITDPAFFQRVTLELFRRVREAGPLGLPAVPIDNLRKPPLDESTRADNSGTLVDAIVTELVRTGFGRTVDTIQGTVLVVPHLQPTTGGGPSVLITDEQVLRANLQDVSAGVLCAVAAHMHYSSNIRITEVGANAIRFRGTGAGDAWLRISVSPANRMTVVPDETRRGLDISDVTRAAEEAIRVVDPLATVTPYGL